MELWDIIYDFPGALAIPESAATKGVEMWWETIFGLQPNLTQNFR